MRLVLISDTHTMESVMTIPDGDMVIHAGDFLSRGDDFEAMQCCYWFRELPHKHKVCVAGNHDICFEDDEVQARDLFGKDVHYLNGEGVELEGIKLWGSPVQPVFFNWAFNHGPEFREKHWKEAMPDDIDILVTHCPPVDVLDQNRDGEPCGDALLREEVFNRVRPHLHVFGHIHESRGCKEEDGISFVNACMVNGNYTPVYDAFVFDYEDGELTLISH